MPDAGIHMEATCVSEELCQQFEYIPRVLESSQLITYFLMSLKCICIIQ